MGSPCGACKFLRRKCGPDCIFVPYFSSAEGVARFAAIHKVFGASNVSKLLSHLPLHHRSEAVVTIAYQAQARIRDPVYGCVAHIFAMQQQVTYLEAQVMQVKAEVAKRRKNIIEKEWQCVRNNSSCFSGIETRAACVYELANESSNSSSSNYSHMVINYESIPQRQDQMMSSDDDDINGGFSDMGELQQVANRMMRSN